MIPRGAGIIQTIAGRELGIREQIETLCIQSYDKETQKPPRVTKKIGKGFLEGLNLGFNRRLLVVDDLVDHGGTMHIALGEIGAKFRGYVHTLGIYAKPEGVKTLDFVGLDVPQHIWIRQPPDTVLAYRVPMSGETD